MRSRCLRRALEVVHLALVGGAVRRVGKPGTSTRTSETTVLPGWCRSTTPCVTPRPSMPRVPPRTSSRTGSGWWVHTGSHEGRPDGHRCGGPLERTPQATTSWEHTLYRVECAVDPPSAEDRSTKDRVPRGGRENVWDASLSGKKMCAGYIDSIPCVVRMFGSIVADTILQSRCCDEALGGADVWTPGT